MDIFKEVATAKSLEIRSERGTLKRSTSNFSEGHRSDTDSGRSSDVENRKYIKNHQHSGSYGHNHMYVPQQVRTLPRHVSDLKVRRDRPPIAQQFNSLPRSGQLNTIGLQESDPRDLSQDKNNRAVQRQDTGTYSRKHPVVRRINEAARRRDFRRNTIDVTAKDLEIAEAALSEGRLNTRNMSKSTNHIDRIGSQETSFEQKIDAFNFESNKNGLSLPDLSVQKLFVLPTTAAALRVRRHRSVREDVNKVMPPTMMDVPVCKGPEFIANATQQARQLDISDAKCQHKRMLNVLLLNGTRIQIRCNPISTTARQIFEAVINQEELYENFFLGLCALVGGDFVFLPMDLKIYKVRF